MFRNNLKIALRNFLRRPGYTLINILGLTLGITTTLFILMYIAHENSFDIHHKKADRIYRLCSDIRETDDAFKWVSTQSPLGPQLKADYPEVEEYVRVIDNGQTKLEHQQQNFYTEKIYFVDSTLNSVFTFNYLFGDPQTALRNPNSLVLNRTLAEAIFGGINPVGKTIDFEERTYQVTGVFEDMPKNSHWIAEALASANTFETFPQATNWYGFHLSTYVLLKPNADAVAFAAKLPQIGEQFFKEFFGKSGIIIDYMLLPLLDIHLKSDFEGEPEPVGEIGFLYIFGAIGVFLLLLACINYMNLSTARATRRATEVGVRKVLGSNRIQLIQQFLSESLLFTIVSLGLSLVLVWLLLPIFNSTFSMVLNSSLLFNSTILFSIITMVGLVGLLGGSYPAFILSAFQPVEVLKGSKGNSTSNSNLRKVLVGVQFAVTLFMLIGTGVIYDQMNYLRDKDLGFNKEQIFTTFPDSDKYDIFKSKLLQHPQINDVGSSGVVLGDGVGKDVVELETETGEMNDYGVNHYPVGYDFFTTLGIEIVKGRNFSREISSDTVAAVMVNEAMVRRLGWTNPIGKKYRLAADSELPPKQIIGVVKDFHQESMYAPIAPLAFDLSPQNGAAHVKIAAGNPENVQAAIAFTETTFRELFPDERFEYKFLDETYFELYQADQIRAKIFTLFSTIMIFIACLGLLGLASFTAEQRTKEIGVRKILGAETSDIIYLLTRNFLVLVVLAALPAFVAAWFFANNWLNTFAYHTSMNYTLYFFAFFIVILLTLLTTGYFALKAARNNPIKALRYE